MPKCVLCTSNKDDDVLYGDFLNVQGISVHTYCLYLTSNLVQNGKDDNGLFGFLPHDIQKETKRIAPLRCKYCGQMSANIGCCERKCRCIFHFTCGLEHNCQNQFTGTYKSFCRRHVRKQLYKPSANEVCCICYDSLQGPNERFSHVNMLHASCCRNGWFHKRCVQKYANTSGYFFKCPMCNDSQTFRKNLLKNGIFIPQRDADWESEPNAFAELLERPSKCSAKICKSTRERSHKCGNDPLIICNTCGSVACHKNCIPGRKTTFCCEDCEVLLLNISSQKVDEEEDMFVVVDDNSDTSDDVFATLRKSNNGEFRRKSVLRLLDDEDNSDESDNDDANKSHHSRTDHVPQEAPSTRDKDTKCDIKNENDRNENMPEVTQPSAVKEWAIDECSTDTNSNICPKWSQDLWRCTTESSKGGSLCNTAVENRKSLPISPSSTNSFKSCGVSSRDSASSSSIKLNCIKKRRNRITSSDSCRGSSTSSSSSNYKNIFWDIQVSGTNSDTSDSCDKKHTLRRYRRIKLRKRRIIDSESSSSSLKPCPKSKKKKPIDDFTSNSDTDDDPAEFYSLYIQKIKENLSTVQDIPTVDEDESKRNCHLAVEQISNAAAGLKVRNSHLKRRDKPTRNNVSGNGSEDITNHNVVNVPHIANRKRHRTTTEMESENARYQHSKTDISCVANRTRRRRPLAALETYFET